MQNLVKLIPVNQLAKLIFENKELREAFFELIKKYAPQILAITGTVLTLEKVKDILEVLKEKKIKFQFKKGDTNIDFNME